MKIDTPAISGAYLQQGLFSFRQYKACVDIFTGSPEKSGKGQCGRTLTLVCNFFFGFRKQLRKMRYILSCTLGNAVFGSIKFFAGVRRGSLEKRRQTTVGSRVNALAAVTC